MGKLDVMGRGYTRRPKGESHRGTNSLGFLLVLQYQTPPFLDRCEQRPKNGPMSGQEWLLRRAFPLFASLLGAGYAAALSFAVFVGDSATAAQTPATTAVHFVCLAGAAGGSVVLALAQRQGLRGRPS